MDMVTSATRRLGIRYPIIQGPFGGGLSTVQLASAVSNKGGLGSYGAHLLSPSEIHAVVGELRRATNAPFAINLWVSDHDPGARTMSRSEYERGAALFAPVYEELGIAIPAFPEPPTWGFAEQVAAVLEAKPPVFSFVFGFPPSEVLSACRARGIVTIGAATTVDESKAVEAAGIDLVVATGFEAGGHRPSFLQAAEASLMGTLALVPQVAARVSIPVIAAGGIVDERGMAAAFALGAQAVQLGTAFLACEESGATRLHRESLSTDAASTTTLSRAFSGRLARLIRNRFIDRMESSGVRPLAYPWQGWFTSFLKDAAAQQNRPDYLALYASQAAPLVRHRTAGDLMQALISGIDRLK